MGNFNLAPPQASENAVWHDAVFYTLTALTVAFTLLVGFLVIFFAIRYRQGSKVNRQRPVYEHLLLELTWTVIPLILGVIMFVVGAKLFVDLRTPPKDSMEIYVVGKQWMWQIQHPTNGVRENNTLHVPIGKPVKLIMISQDVTHAFYIPAFRVQYHVVPGRYTDVWFTPSKTGTYPIYCGMYCGTQHSEMTGQVVVMEQAEFAEWLDNGGNDVQPSDLITAGHDLFKKLNCGSCHGVNDTIQGPTLQGLYGKMRKFENGGSKVADDAYIRESIVRPYEHIVSGYGREMGAYDDRPEEDILRLTAYIKSLGTGNPTGKTIDENEPHKGSTPAPRSHENPIATGAISHELKAGKK